MSHNELKKHTVKVGSGSGCLFQPMDEGYTYILTAKHLFQTDEPKAENRAYVENGSEIMLTFQYHDNDEWIEDPVPFILEIGVNFFPHEKAQVDAVILKIPYKEGFDNIFIRDTNTADTFYLCGFPGRLNDEDEPGNKYTPYAIIDFFRFWQSL
tara:strand:+ start:18707 stop:19168 length:462 start_codon:yes stop_codon:yes gene_type:complete